MRQQEAPILYQMEGHAEAHVHFLCIVDPLIKIDRGSLTFGLDGRNRRILLRWQLLVPCVLGTVTLSSLLRPHPSLRYIPALASWNHGLVLESL